MNTPARETGEQTPKGLLPMNDGKRRGRQGRYTVSIHASILLVDRILSLGTSLVRDQNLLSSSLLLSLSSLCLSPSGWCINKREGEGHPALEH